MAGAISVANGAVRWLPFVPDNQRLDFFGIVPWVVGGILCILVGRWLQKRLLPETTPTFVPKQGDTQFIAAMLQRQGRVTLLVGLSLLAIDAGLLLVFPSLDEPKKEPRLWIEVAFVSAIMLLIGGVGVILLYQSFRLRKTPAVRLYRILTQSPEQVTGLTVHFFQVEDTPGTLGRQILLAIHVAGEELRAGASAEQCSLLRQYIQQHSPQAYYREVKHELPLIMP
jgi:hypothetical protein